MRYASLSHDFMGHEDCPALALFPGMDLPRDRKLSIVSDHFEILARDHETVTMGEHARWTGAGREALPTLAPAFSD